MIQLLLSQIQAEFLPLEWGITSKIVPAPDVIIVVYVYLLLQFGRKKKKHVRVTETKQDSGQDKNGEFKTSIEYDVRFEWYHTPTLLTSHHPALPIITTVLPILTLTLHHALMPSLHSLPPPSHSLTPSYSTGGRRGQWGGSRPLQV